MNTNMLSLVQLGSVLLACSAASVMAARNGKLQHGGKPVVSLLSPVEIAPVAEDERLIGWQGETYKPQDYNAGVSMRSRLMETHLRSPHSDSSLNGLFGSQEGTPSNSSDDKKPW